MYTARVTVRFFLLTHSSIFIMSEQGLITCMAAPEEDFLKEWKRKLLNTNKRQVHSSAEAVIVNTNIISANRVHALGRTVLEV
mmetsp:Transcript_29573/g.67962  ORF Transcript_29573/g.67962 Transcript_29573/m.67962 type:complete len:83 (+) Transcript_29573:64-312(+)